MRYDDLADLIEQAQRLGPMTDEQRREQAASFAFGNLALTTEWQNKGTYELTKLREICRKAAGLPPRLTLEEKYQDALREIEHLRGYLKTFAEGWDHDSGPEGAHPDYCRACTAKKLSEGNVP